MDFEEMKLQLDELLQGGRHAALRKALSDLNEVDLAEYLNTVDREKLPVVFRILSKDKSSDVFAYMDADRRQLLIEMISEVEVTRLIDEMFIDDAVDFLEELPAGVVKRILQNANAEKRDQINQILLYPDSSAGSIMTTEFCESHADVTAQQALEEIRKTGVDKETIYTIYVIDGRRRLIGTVALRSIILAKDEERITELMSSNVISVNTLDDRQAVVDAVRKYDLISIPVVDKESRLVGIITVDDIMDVIEEEDTEDFEKMAALIPSEEDYLKTGVFALAKNRFLWLLILMISATVTGMIITRFEGILNGSAVGVMLMSCVPMLMDTGGNAGSQASTLVIRSLALGDIAFKDLPRVLFKEIRVSALLGVVLAVINFGRLTIFNHFSVTVALIVSVSMFLTIVLAKSIGALLPLCAQRVHLDPALMASPLITTIVDACSLMILFTLASRMLGVAA
jgi:magnesium transporter